ncbi:MAG: PAS domain S-box protein [Desulfobacterales bacterium]|nr:PAS domain S-box protein [Desulfobacterales bacterium]
MKKYTLLLFFILLQQWILPPPSNSADPVRVGVYQSPPLSFVDDKGRARGLFIDILEYIADREGWKIKYMYGSKSECLDKLQSGEIDLLGAVPLSKSRRKIFSYTYESLITDWGQVYVNTESDIESILDLKDRKIAVLYADVYFNELKKLLRQFEIESRFIEVYEYEDAFNLVESGRCEAALVSQIYGLQRDRLFDIRKSAIILSPQRLFWAAPAGKNQEMLNLLDIHVRKLKGDKTSIYHVKVAQWFGIGVTSAYGKWVIWGSVCFAVLFILVVAINLILRVQVKTKTKELRIKNETLIKEIRHREMAEEAVKKSEQRLAQIIDFLPDATFAIDRDGRVVAWNKTMEEMTGVKKEDILDKGDHEYALPFYGERRPVLIDLVRNWDNRAEYYYRSLKWEGETLVSETTNPPIKPGAFLWNRARILYDADGEATGAIESIRDITDRERDKEELRKSEEKLRLLAQNIDDVIWTMDTRLNFIYISPAVEALQGWTVEEILAMKAEDLLTPPSRKIAMEMTKALSASGDIAEKTKEHPVLELEFYRKDGSTVWTEVKVSLVVDEDGKPAGLSGVTRDITERVKARRDKKELREKLERSEKMEALGVLAGGVAHDLNNVLSGIVSYPELLLMDLPEDSPLVKPIRTIQASGQKAAAIVQDLLTLARRGVRTMEALNLNDIVQDYMRSPELKKLRSYYPDVRIETRLEKTPLSIEGSPVHLKKTVMNLVSNAVEAGISGGEVMISTKNRSVDAPVKGLDDVPKGDYVVLEVADKGTGIAPDDLDRIFEPFYTKKVMGRSGTGLGMAVVWGTIQDHHGYIHVESVENEGTTFYLYFPATRKQIAGETEATPMKEYAGKGQSVLIIDDVPEQREIASVILKKLNYSTAAVSSGEEAVAYMKNHTADLLLLDMIMDPGMDGLDAYREIIKHHPGQKAVIASGFSETDRIKKVQKLGAGAYIKKPYTIEKIGLAIKSELGEK